MYVSKVLKRKDASSLIVAVSMGVAFAFFLMSISSQPAVWLSRANYGGPGQNWKDALLIPLVTLVVELILLEICLRLVVNLRPLFVRKK
jgi:Na+-translocating ferredoxin:NAD+ oxidoreductase RnfD subunit